jgi:hypothetical protein
MCRRVWVSKDAKTHLVGSDGAMSRMYIHSRTQIGMFRPIRMDHTNCLQVAIKSIQFNSRDTQTDCGPI